jgi:hypothetical protein
VAEEEALRAEGVEAAQAYSRAEGVVEEPRKCAVKDSLHPE